MRVLVTVNDAYGHLLPLLPTVRELARRGHEVLLACPGRTADAIPSTGVRVRRYEPRTPPPPVPAPPRERRADRLTWSVRTSWPNAARGWAGALLADAREFRPEVVVCEPVEHAGRVCAAALAVPLVEHGWGFTLPAGSDVAATEGLADLYSALGVTPAAPILRVDFGPAHLQAADAEPDVHRYRHVPATVPGEPLPPPGNRPRVLLTLGTFPHPAAAQRLRAAAYAAAELDVEPVVVLGNEDRGNDVRRNDVRRNDVRRNDNQGTPGDWPPGSTVVRWVNLPVEITRCALVVHHGGAGTSWATAVAGVPAVVLPQAGDQFRNAELLAAAGAAAVLGPDDADPPALRRTFAAALADPALVTGADWVRRANEALPPVTALVDQICSLHR